MDYSRRLNGLHPVVLVDSEPKGVIGIEANLHDSSGHCRTALLEDLHDEAEHGFGLGDDFGKMIDEVCGTASLLDCNGLLRHGRHCDDGGCSCVLEDWLAWREEKRLGQKRRGLERRENGVKGREKDQVEESKGLMVL